MPAAILSGRVPGLDWLPARFPGSARSSPPDLLVIHSAAIGDDPAGYLSRCPDGRQVSAHISARSRDGGFVQQVLLNRLAWHAGGSVFQGRGGVNARSVGVELPAHEGALLADAWAALLAVLLPACPSLHFWTCHRWIRASKSDPVCWSDARVRLLMAPAGLVEGR